MEELDELLEEELLDDEELEDELLEELELEELLEEGVELLEDELLEGKALEEELLGGAVELDDGRLLEDDGVLLEVELLEGVGKHSVSVISTSMLNVLSHTGNSELENVAVSVPPEMDAVLLMGWSLQSNTIVQAPC